MLLLSAVPLSQHSSYIGRKPSIDSAIKYINVREIKPNRSVEIDRFNRFVGVALGSSWCGAFVSYCTNGNPVKAALARKHYTGKIHSAGEVIRGLYKPKFSDKIVWARGETIFGHIGFVLNWNKNSGLTIEGNTSSGASGSQSNGDGVFIRHRQISLYNYFRIIGFVEMN